MKLLLFFLLFHPDTVATEEGLDTIFFKRFILNTNINVMFNFYESIRRRSSVDGIDPQVEFNKYIQYQSEGKSLEGYTKPDELGYAFAGGFRFMAGFSFATSLHFGKYVPELIYGINFSYEKYIFNTSKDIREQIFDFNAAYLASQGNSSQSGYYSSDSVTVRKVQVEWAGVIPLAIRFPIKKGIGLETGTFIKVLKSSFNDKYAPSMYTREAVYGGPAFELNPYLAVFYNVKNKFIIQLGVDSYQTVFLSFQI